MPVASLKELSYRATVAQYVEGIVSIGQVCAMPRQQRDEAYQYAFSMMDDGGKQELQEWIESICLEYQEQVRACLRSQNETPVDKACKALEVAGWEKTDELAHWMTCVGVNVQRSQSQQPPCGYWSPVGIEKGEMILKACLNLSSAWVFCRMPSPSSKYSHESSYVHTADRLHEVLSKARTTTGMSPEEVDTLVKVFAKVLSS